MYKITFVTDLYQWTRYITNKYELSRSIFFHEWSLYVYDDDSGVQKTRTIFGKILFTNCLPNSQVKI